MAVTRFLDPHRHRERQRGRGLPFRIPATGAPVNTPGNGAHRGGAEAEMTSSMGGEA
jgi:hypothetical protein